MTESPVTRVSLLLRLRDPRDVEAWGDFVEVYGPLVFDYGRRHGLQEADAADLTQEVLRAVARSAGACDHRRRGLRSQVSRDGAAPRDDQPGTGRFL